jgi:SnoaL-like domain
MTTVAGDPGRSADSQAVSQLVLRERQSRDRGWWDDMADCFADDAVIEMSWFTGLANDFIRETRERSIDGVWGRHRLSPPTVRLCEDRAWAELPLGIEFDTDVDGVAADLVSYCRSQYRARRGASGIWRLDGSAEKAERPASKGRPTPRGRRYS